MFGDFTRQELEILYIERKLRRSKKRIGSEPTNQTSPHGTDKSDTLFDNFDLVNFIFLSFLGNLIKCQIKISNYFNVFSYLEIDLKVALSLRAYNLLSLITIKKTFT